MKLRKKASNDAISKLANMNHVSMDEIKCEMKKVIDAAMNNPDPQKRAEFSKYFGDKNPSPEEFIYVISKSIMENKTGK